MSNISTHRGHSKNLPSKDGCHQNHRHNHLHHNLHQKNYQHNLNFCSGTLGPSRQPRKRVDLGYQKKEDKLSSYITCYKISGRNNSCDNRSDNNKNYYSPGNNNWFYNHSTFITHHETKKKGKKTIEGTAWGDGILSELKKKNEWRNTSKKLCTQPNPPTEKPEKQTMRKTKEKTQKKKQNKVPFFSTAGNPTTLPWKRKITSPQTTSTHISSRIHLWWPPLFVRLEDLWRFFEKASRMDIKLAELEHPSLKTIMSFCLGRVPIYVHPP